MPERATSAAPAHGGLTAAVARGRDVLDSWVSDGIVLPREAFAARRGVSVGWLNAAVRRGELFSLGIRDRRYYVAALLDVEADDAARVCAGLIGIDDSEKAIFWIRRHGALGAKTVVEAVRTGDRGRVLLLAGAWAAERAGSS